MAAGRKANRSDSLIIKDSDNQVSCHSDFGGLGSCHFSVGNLSTTSEHSAADYTRNTAGRDRPCPDEVNLIVDMTFLSPIVANFPQTPECRKNPERA